MLSHSHVSGSQPGHWSVVPLLPGDPFQPYYRSSKREQRQQRRKRGRLATKLLQAQARMLEEQQRKQWERQQWERAVAAAQHLHEADEERRAGIYLDDESSTGDFSVDTAELARRDRRAERLDEERDLSIYEDDASGVDSAFFFNDSASDSGSGDECGGNGDGAGAGDQHPTAVSGAQTAAPPSYVSDLHSLVPGYLRNDWHRLRSEGALRPDAAPARLSLASSAPPLADTLDTLRRYDLKLHEAAEAALVPEAEDAAEDVQLSPPRVLYARVTPARSAGG